MPNGVQGVAGSNPAVPIGDKVYSLRALDALGSFLVWGGPRRGSTTLAARRPERSRKKDGFPPDLQETRHGGPPAARILS